MIDRFKSADVGAEVIRRSEELEIKLLRREDGAIDSVFKISGSTFALDDDDGDTIDSASQLEFIRQLMLAFEGNKTV